MTYRQLKTLRQSLQRKARTYAALFALFAVAFTIAYLTNAKPVVTFCAGCSAIDLGLWGWTEIQIAQTNDVPPKD